jgi:hypothetical protein
MGRELLSKARAEEQQEEEEEDIDDGVPIDLPINPTFPIYRVRTLPPHPSSAVRVRVRANVVSVVHAQTRLDVLYWMHYYYKYVEHVRLHASLLRAINIEQI